MSLLRCQTLGLELLEDRCLPSVAGIANLAGSRLVAPAQAQWGQPITLQAQIQNLGTASSGSFQVQWFLSPNSSGSNSDLLLQTSSGAMSLTQSAIAANHSGPLFSVTVQLPAAAPAGWNGVSFWIIEKINVSTTAVNTHAIATAGLGRDRDPIEVLGNKITGVISLPQPDGEHRTSIDVFLQRISTDARDNPQTNMSIQVGIQTWVVIHGRDDSSASFQSLAAAIDGYKPGDQVLVLDWAEGAADNHLDGLELDGAIWIPSVGSWAASTLATLGVTSSKLDLVGHSWGTYVAYEIARDVPGHQDLIVALDPAAAAVDYNYSAVNFAAVSRNSWAFYGNGLFGSADLAKTAREAFLLSYDTTSWVGVDALAAHEAPVSLFQSLVLRNNQGGAPLRASLFSLARLENPILDPWVANPSQGGFDGVFTLRDSNNNNLWGDTWTEVESFRYLNVRGQTVMV